MILDAAYLLSPETIRPSVPTKATLQNLELIASCGLSGPSMMLIYSDYSYPIMQMVLNLKLIAFNAL